MADELKNQRVVTMMSPSELKAIDDWMFGNRVRSRGEAIRRLCQMGIILDREISPMVSMVTEHIRASVQGEKPPLRPEEYQRMFQDMAISLLNAGTVLTKLDNASTDEAIKGVTELYEYYAAEARKAEHKKP